MMEQSVFEEFYPKIYNYVYYRVLHRQNAEDITGEVFYKAVAGAALFDGCRASYSTWLFTIAHNCVVNFHRGRKNVVVLNEFVEAAARDDDVDDALLAGEEIQRLHALLKELPERERAILALRFWGEFSYSEIARQTGLSVSNVGVILNRTIEKLRALW